MNQRKRAGDRHHLHGFTPLQMRGVAGSVEMLSRASQPAASDFAITAIISTTSPLKVVVAPELEQNEPHIEFQ
jgi:hypothetical protein